MLTCAANITSTSLVDLAMMTSRKGGLSVWLAAKIATGRLSRSEREYFYRMGANAQLLDDLVDVGEDLADGSNTIWTKGIAKPYGMLDRGTGLDEGGATRGGCRIKPERKRSDRKLVAAGTGVPPAKAKLYAPTPKT